MGKIEYLVSEFERIVGAPPERMARAPGRVNLIGEHTDYNDGFVMPIAINYDVLIAASRRRDRQLVGNAPRPPNPPMAMGRPSPCSDLPSTLRNESDRAEERRT